VRRDFSTHNDPHQVVAEPRAHFFGGELYERTLLPNDDAELAPTLRDEWFAHYAAGR
jgi:hypothetical protein